MNRKTDSAAKGLLADDRGAVFLWTLFVALPVFFALGAVVVDAHRTYNTFDEAQSFADHTALAAAMELNGRPGAIDRAIKAACGPNPGPLVTGFHTYGNAAVSGARALAADQLVFLSALGTDPGAPNQYTRASGDVEICTASCTDPVPNCPDFETVPDGEARFIEVTTAPVTVSWLLAPVMNAFGVNLGASANAAARATAGMTKAACNVPPLYICSGPLEKGVQVKVVAQGPSSSVANGNWGYIDAFDAPGNSTSAYRDAVGRLDPGTNQCTGYTVNVKPGVAAASAVGFNVRFDIFEPGFAGAQLKNNQNYPSARNVTKGTVTNIQGNNCNYSDSTDTMAIPRDSNLSDPNVRFGNGNWDCNAYWNMNHGGNCPIAFASRWDLYQYEISNGIPDKSLNGSENGDASKEPRCSNQHWTPTPDSGLLDRREFIVAMLDNCSFSGNASNISVREYARMFMTEPAGSPPDVELYMEYIEAANAENLSEVFKEYPVLYR